MLLKNGMELVISKTQKADAQELLDRAQGVLANGNRRGDDENGDRTRT
jgi:predicted solute-binding protein